MVPTPVRRLAAIAAGLFFVGGMAVVAQEKPVVGVTLHPYYSFVSVVVEDTMDVVPLIPSDVNPHGYQPQPEDIKRATSLDVLVVNAIGHDEWAFEIIGAAGRGEDLPLISANAQVALIPISGSGEDRIVNPHTFVSTTAAIQQVYEIAGKLGEMYPEHAEQYRANARAYGARIRQLRAEYLKIIGELDLDNFRVATMHAGYDYLFQEMGMTIQAVVEPRHGVSPTPRQLAQTIEDIRAAGVTTLFAEKYFAGDLAETITRETGVRVYSLSHISEGEMTPTKFEEEMRNNLDVLVQAIKESQQ